MKPALLAAFLLLPAAGRASPSVPNALNCALGGGESSNYVLPSRPSAPFEVHVVSVKEGRFGADESARERGAAGSVRVVIHKTRKPAVLVLNAQTPTLWSLLVAKEASLQEVILQGPGDQTVKGAPDGIAVGKRTPQEAGALSDHWEASGEFQTMIQGIRCLTGVREASFQGCALGLVFEVPHYRPEAQGVEADDIAPACPGSLAQQADFKAGSSSSPAIVVHLTPDYLSARAEAILLKGDKTLLDAGAVSDLVAVMERGDGRLQSLAAQALGELGPAAREAAPALRRALKSNDPGLRKEAKAALRRVERR